MVVAAAKQIKEAAILYKIHRITSAHMQNQSIYYKGCFRKLRRTHK
jgi:hypothetical protein